MRILPILFCIMFFAACTYQGAVKRFSLAALQFPLLDEDNGGPLLPNSYKKNLVDHRIAARVSSPFSENFSDCSSRQQENYLRYLKSIKISVSDWFKNVYNQSDTNFYDLQGNMYDYHGDGSLWYYTERFVYDTNNFEIARDLSHGAMAEHTINYLYYFNADSRLLFEVTESRNAEHGIHSISDLLHRDLVEYFFDILGQLNGIMRFYGNLEHGYYSNSRISYRDGIIDSIVTTNYLAPKSSERNVDCAGKIADSGVVKYYYTGNKLDSVITHEFIKPKFERFRKTYYDERGLAVRTKFENYRSQYGTDWVVYNYIHH